MGDIRLAEGLIPNAGRLEVCINKVWGTVCDHGWPSSSVSVVCKQLGFQPYGKFPYMANITMNPQLCSVKELFCDIFFGGGGGGGDLVYN